MSVLSVTPSGPEDRETAGSAAPYPVYSVVLLCT